MFIELISICYCKNLLQTFYRYVSFPIYGVSQTSHLLRAEFRAGPRFQERSRYWDQSPTEFTSLALLFMDFRIYYSCNEPTFLNFLDEMISGISMSKM